MGLNKWVDYYSNESNRDQRANDRGPSRPKPYLQHGRWHILPTELFVDANVARRNCS